MFPICLCLPLLPLGLPVTFEPSSSGQIALVIYEWSDGQFFSLPSLCLSVEQKSHPSLSSSSLPVQYLGAVTPSIGDNVEDDDYLPKTYICSSSSISSSQSFVHPIPPKLTHLSPRPSPLAGTTSAVRSHLCSPSALGEFIVVLPSSTTLNDTSIFTQGLRFRDSARVASLGRRQEDGDDDAEDEVLDEGGADYSELIDDGGETEDDGIPMVTGIRHGKGAAAAKATTTDTPPPTTDAAPTSTPTTTKKKQKHKGSKHSSTLLPSASKKPKKVKPTTTAEKEAAAAEPTSLPSIDEDPADEGTTEEQQEDTSSGGAPWYDGGVISYELKKTGYYCVSSGVVSCFGFEEGDCDAKSTLESLWARQIASN